jgi:hypothetical protein
MATTAERLRGICDFHSIPYSHQTKPKYVEVAIADIREILAENERLRLVKEAVENIVTCQKHLRNTE